MGRRKTRTSNGPGTGETVAAENHPPTPAAGFTATVRGRVQGVGFRFFVCYRAEALGLRGFVANQPDGSVRVSAAGRRDALDLLLESLRQGPPHSRVDDVAVDWGTPSVPAGGFQIRP